MAARRLNAMALLLVALMAASAGMAAAGCAKQHTAAEPESVDAATVPPSSLLAYHAAALNETDEVEAPHGRVLQQQELDCKRVNANCATCRNQRIPGTKNTQLVCSTCQAPNWRLRQDGLFKTCDCAPGFYKAGGQCVVCATPKYCAGGDANNPTSASTACPAGLATTFAGAKSQAQCFTIAGYGRKATTAGNGQVVLSGSLCQKGWFNVGKNTAGCQQCPPGTTTAGPGANASQLCLAPAGSYMDRGVGRLCPKGTYTDALNRAVACTPCPQGVTTASEGSVGIDTCVLSKRGWFMTGRATAQPCPLNTYTDKENTIVEAPCIPCAFGWRTRDVAAEGLAECLAPPGWELKPDATLISKCEVGWFKAGWNRNPCVACGPGVLTAERGATARDDCIVPPGWGVSSLMPLAAAKCNMGRYGDDEPRPALAGATCTSCPPNSFTLDALLARYPNLAGLPAPSYYTRQEDCLSLPGWGVTTSALVEICPNGTYSPGFTREPCRACPAKHTTLGPGKTSVAACVVQPGWANDTPDGVPRPCDKGTWGSGGVEGAPNSTCYTCPWGYTTQEPESESADDCNACDAGHGGAGCGVCWYDTYATGGQKDGQGCWPCAEGTVASRRRYNSEHCYPVWLEPIFDVWPLSDNALWVDIAGANSSAACAEQCDADVGCVMYRYAPASRSCQHLPMDDAASPRQQLAFQVAGGDDYVLYFLSAGVTVGAPVADVPGYVTLLTCLRACNADTKCEMVSFLPANGATTGLCSDTQCPVGTCAMRASILDADWVGQVHVQGPHLYSDQLPNMTFYARPPPAATPPDATGGGSGGGGTSDLGGGSISDLPPGLPTGDPIDPPSWPICSYDNVTGVHNLTEIEAPEDGNNSTSGGGSTSSLDALDPDFDCAACQNIPSWANGYASCIKNKKKCDERMEVDTSSNTCGCAAAPSGNDTTSYLYTGGSHRSVNCAPAVWSCHEWTAAEQADLNSGVAPDVVCHRGGRVYNGGAFYNPNLLGVGASCVCAKPPPWTCHAWTVGQRAALSNGQSQKGVCENSFPYNKFTNGANAGNALGCGNCGCCSRSWQCRAMSNSELNSINSGQKTAKQVCEQGNGVWTQGANANYFGCGACHCCKKPNMGSNSDD